MPRITRLTSGRRAGRVLLEVDGHPWGAVPDSIALSRGLREGRLLEDSELEDLGAEVERAGVLDAALHCLAYRPRSRRELLLHLRRKGHPEQSITAAILRCEELGYLDDTAFARSFVRDRVRFRPVGRYRLRSELGARGIEAAAADAAIDDAFRELGVSEADLLVGVATRRARALRSVERSKARRRLSGYLLRRGFAGADVRSVVDDVLPESDPS